ncbi:MAG: hypothetical protein ACKV2V_08035 [Blastocatellia bacterium]
MHHICLPFDSETQYDACVNDCGKYREFLTQRFHQYPELFPRGFDAGFHFHARYRLKKLNLFLRRIKVNSTGKVFTIRPSFIMPYGTGRTDEVWKPLLLHAEGASLETLVEVFGHDLHYWERMWLSLGRPSLVGTTVKDPEKIPANLVADEKITWQDGEEVLITTIASEGCFLGAAMARGESAAELETAYGEFKAEVRKLAENYTPESVCTDGFRSTRLAWLNLFPKAVLILCFLHGILKIRERCRGELREETLTRAWHCYHARTRREFSQRLRRLDEWAEQNLTGSALEMVKKLSFNRGRYTIAYEMPAAYRTTSAVDRLMNHQDRMLYATCYLHGSDEKARLNVRAKALQWNFHTYSQRVRREDPARISPFADLNGFVYHENWLHNLLIAASLGGHPT